MNRIIVFAKFPQPGMVKTRLAAAIGSANAAALYSALLSDTLHIVRSSGLAASLFISPDTAESRRFFTTLLWQRCRMTPQKGRDLGERMANAFESVFNSGAQRAVLIGSDAPELSNSILRKAFAALESNDVVLGPSVDGGYYLIGFTRAAFIRAPFENMPWSSDAVYSETMKRLRDHGRNVHLLAKLRDIDNIHDLSALKHTGSSKSHLAAFLLQHPNLVG